MILAKVVVFPQEESCLVTENLYGHSCNNESPDESNLCELSNKIGIQSADISELFGENIPEENNSCLVIDSGSSNNLYREMEYISNETVNEDLDQVPIDTGNTVKQDLATKFIENSIIVDDSLPRNEVNTEVIIGQNSKEELEVKDLRPFKCNDCSATFAKKGNLTGIKIRIFAVICEDMSIVDSAG